MASFGGVTKDCVASQSDCYNLLKTYLTEDSDGAALMADMGRILHNNARKELELEQSLSRNRLCQGNYKLFCCYVCVVYFESLFSMLLWWLCLVLVKETEDNESAEEKCGALATAVVDQSENALQGASVRMFIDDFVFVGMISRLKFLFTIS
jgi:hypothetical protein